MSADGCRVCQWKHTLWPATAAIPRRVGCTTRNTNDASSITQWTQLSLQSTAHETVHRARSTRYVLVDSCVFGRCKRHSTRGNLTVTESPGVFWTALWRIPRNTWRLSTCGKAERALPAVCVPPACLVEHSSWPLGSARRMPWSGGLVEYSSCNSCLVSEMQLVWGQERERGAVRCSLPCLVTGGQKVPAVLFQHVSSLPAVVSSRSYLRSPGLMLFQRFFCYKILRRVVINVRL